MSWKNDVVSLKPKSSSAVTNASSAASSLNTFAPPTAVAATAVGGANVFKLDAADDALVTADDDFGFNETRSFFQDADDYDPASGTDKES